MPATSNGCFVCAKHASTIDGAARSATLRIAPGPLSAVTASRSTSLVSRATTATSGLAFLASKAISRFVASSFPAQMTAAAWVTSASSSSVLASLTTVAPAFSSSWMIVVASASSPLTMMWWCMLVSAY